MYRRIALSSANRMHYMGDRWGPRRVLMRIVLWWSFFTAATGWAFNFLSLLLTQLLFGAGEAGCFPNITRALATWLPREERFAVEHMGKAVTPFGNLIIRAEQPSPHLCRSGISPPLALRCESTRSPSI